MSRHRDASRTVLGVTPNFGAFWDRTTGNSRSRVRSRRGLTLVELTISLTITSMMSVVLLGLINAVHTAHRHSEGQETAGLQAQAALERISYMVSQAGTYKLDGHQTQLGVRVVARYWSSYEMPDILVVWSGGRDGGKAKQGQHSRLPVGNELVVYAPDLKDPSRFFEYAFPDWTGSVDFQSDSFDDDIIRALESDLAERAKLTDRVRVTSLGTTSDQDWPNVRFSTRQTPSELELTTTDPDSDAWEELHWSQGITTSTGGLVRTVVRIELQLEPRSYAISDAHTSVAIPFLGSASTRYVYEK